MSVVTFLEDIFPYVKGEVRNLEADEQKRVDAVAKSRNVDNPYKSGAHDVAEAVNDAREQDVKRARDNRSAAQQNQVDQAAVLEAQRKAVAEPANVDALGVAPETPPSVVTGTKPVDDVEVTNPNEATDLGNPAGAEVKGGKAKK